MDVYEHLAEKLLRLVKGERIPASSLQYPLIEELYNEEIIKKEEKRNNKVLYYIDDPHFLISYLRNNDAASHLPAGLLETLKIEITQRFGKVRAPSNPLSKKRKLEGFFVASFETIETKLSGRTFLITPQTGVSLFVNDFSEFVPSPDTTIVGIESAENFKSVERLKYLFEGKKVLFVFKHPQSSYLTHWLQTIPNNYLHFTDFDFFSISIYYSRYKKRLDSRCELFIPPDLENQLMQNGKHELYDDQMQIAPSGDALKDNSIHQVVTLINKYQKGLEQEIFIK